MVHTRQDLLKRLEDDGYAYGDLDAFERSRRKEYPSLKDTVYLDYAASPPAPVTPIRRFGSTIASSLYTNPHSASASAAATALLVDRVRIRVLTELFGIEKPHLDKWDVVFTPGGATSGIRMVGEAWDWRTEDDKSSGRVGLRYLVESHTSLVGLRGIALARSSSVAVHETPSSLLQAARRSRPACASTSTLPSLPTLYTYPAQCNATGARLGLRYCSQIKKADPGAIVLVDAAAYCATNVLDLGSVNEDEAPDFVVGSFYKIFGWPTSLGFLIVHRRSSHHLSSTPFFGGGTISSLSLFPPFGAVPRTPPFGFSHPTVHQRLEMGTIPYLEIIALGEAMDWLQETCGGLREVGRHTGALRRLAEEMLEELKHEAPLQESEEGTKALVQHRAFEPLTSEPAAEAEDNLPPDLQVIPEPPGPTLGFSLLSPPPFRAGDVQARDFRQTHVGHVHLSRLAAVNGISLRTGGLCNTGVWTRAFGVEDEELRALELAGRACWDDEEYSPYPPYRPLGIARISFGAASTVDDVLAFVDFVKRFFVRGKEVVELGVAPPAKHAAATERVEMDGGVHRVKLGSLMLYPIKSCAAQPILSATYPTGWPLTPTGLLYDREFMLVDPSSGQVLSQKRYPRMALIQPSVDLAQGVLTVKAKGMVDLVLALPFLGSTGLATPPLSRASSTFTSSSNPDSPLSLSPVLDHTPTLLCGAVIPSTRVSSLADSWFSTFLSLPSIELRRLPPGSAARHAHFEGVAGRGVPLPLRLSNESPFLLVTEASTRRVNEWIERDAGAGSGEKGVVRTSAFRPNFVVDDLGAGPRGAVEPFWEDEVELVRIGGQVFARLGRCRRCLMVAVDQETGLKTKEPLSTLSQYRKSTTSGRIEFGVHFYWREDLSTQEEGEGDRWRRVKVGDEVAFRLRRDGKTGKEID
ncbi:hypothetical protein JCM1841_001820 [Sporobolomyces salmonicolor]